MPLNAQDKAWIQQEINTSHQKHGGARILAWLKDWGALAVLLTIAAAGLSQWTAYVEFRTKTVDRLEGVEAQLRVFTASSSPKKVLSQLATLNSASLSKNLEALKKVSEQPSSAVVPANTELRDIRENLAQINEATPDYWPTTLQFIEFASSHYGTEAPRSNDGRSHISNVAGISMNSTVVELSGTIANSVFTNSRIIFTSKPALLQNVHFVNCVFVFEGADNPTPDMRSVGRKLLALGIQDATITAG